MSFSRVRTDELGACTDAISKQDKACTFSCNKSNKTLTSDLRVQTQDHKYDIYIISLHLIVTVPDLCVSLNQKNFIYSIIHACAER